ncbi:FNTB [Symbiodinium pilosum]|uniref:FNTB protein n=1 Tax=Symbiodinium pilosum TaxID=2952 RepID=A0A812XFU2_SYMPI|nr:FNTB [Symbiodinium pilosum]
MACLFEGHFSGLKFPHNAEQLKSFGPSWYTQAFHKFGTLPSDNSVVKVVHVEQLPHSGFDAAGGAGHKAFIELQYAKPDPNLHTKLFAKYPWDFFESETGKRYRMQISTYQDMDSLELLTNISCEHLFPFRIPKLYFADINRDTTNYVLIVERIPFGRRGKVVNGKVTEKIERKPFEILPVCGKYQDYLLEDAPSIYYALFREMAHLAAWDHQGRYDSVLGPMTRYSEEDFLNTQVRVRKPQKQKKLDVFKGGCKSMIEKGVDFALNVGSQIFTPAGRDKKKLEKLMKEITEIAPHFDDIRLYVANSSDWVAAMHMNLQADNAYFWHDENGDLDVGVFDWCGFSRTAFVGNFMGCLSGADADLLDAHEEGLMRMFCDEYERYGGPRIDPAELLLKYHLQWPSFTMDACQWVERDIYVQCPKEEWSTIKTIYDDKFVDRWNVRCRGTTLVNAFEFYSRRDFKKIFDDWISGPGKAYRLHLLDAGLATQCGAGGRSVAMDLPEKEYQEKLLKVTLRVQRHWRVVTARKVFADQAAASYTGSTANKQSFLLHWQAKYLIANNLPTNDAHWDSDDPSWVGKASMSKRHRFLIRRNLHWRWFNALVFGMLDDQERVFPAGKCCPDTVSEIKMMKEAALTWVEGARESEGWSHNIGLFFHVYGHNSVNSLHLHVVDLDFTGPSFESQKFKNLPIDAVLQVLEQEAAATPEGCERSLLSSLPAIEDTIDLKQETVKATPILNTADLYRKARLKFLELGGVRALRDQLTRQGFLKAHSPKLTTNNKPFNVFARLAYQDTVGRCLYTSDTSLNKIANSRRASQRGDLSP